MSDDEATDRTDEDDTEREEGGSGEPDDAGEDSPGTAADGEGSDDRTDDETDDGSDDGGSDEEESDDRPDPETMQGAVDRVEARERDDQSVMTGHDVAAELLEDWRVLTRGLHARFATGDFATGAALVADVASAADEADHHPDVELRYPHVDVHLRSHDVGGITMRDVRLARRISDLAGRRGAKAAPDDVQVLEVALDTADRDAVRPFWKAVLGLSETNDPDEIVDGSGTLPAMWFQGTERHEEPRQRFHLDIHVPRDVAERRVAAALEAGGTLVTDGYAPSFWVLADAEGNKACVCTWVGHAASDVVEQDEQGEQDERGESAD